MSSTIEARFRTDRGAFHLDVTLNLPSRGVIALYGVSGSGKTTVLRCIAGLLRTAQGYLRVNGEVWQDEAQGVYLPPTSARWATSFQDTALFSHLDVRRNLKYGMKRVPPALRRVSWQQAIDLLGIGHLLSRMPAGLSGGERQRIGIARALLSSPQLLLLDEPLAALDVARKREILPYLERLHDELSIPVLLVSHAPDEVARLADHLVVLEAGKVLTHGPLAETLTRLDLTVRLGEDAGVVLAGRVVARDRQWQLARIDTPAGELWTRDGGVDCASAVRVRILARDVSIALDPGTCSITNTLPATVVALGDDEHPALALVRLRVGSEFVLARLTRRSAAYLQLQPGLQVWVQIKAVALL